MVISKYGPFDGYVHCIGLLFDSKSGLKSLNQYASGSSSIPGDSVTYDDITRRTAFNLIEAVEKVACDADQTCKNNIPLVFISAAEAGWTFKAPVDFLERYLLAKRSVEKRLLEQSPIVRAVVMRPSLIWTWDRPQGLLSVIPFYIGSKIGKCFILKLSGRLDKCPILGFERVMSRYRALTCRWDYLLVRDCCFIEVMM